MSLLILFEQKKTAKFFLRSGFIIIYGILLLLFNSCGLPTYAYMYPPTDVKDRSDPVDEEYDLIFRNAYKNDNNTFIGYELYYKIYDPLDSDNSESEYFTDYNLIDSSTLTGETLLENYDFQRLFTTTDIDSGFIHNNSKPAFPIEYSLLDKDFYIRLLFQQGRDTADSYYADTWYDYSSDFAETPYLYRYVENDSTNTTTKKFFNIDDFDINDSDMPLTIDSNSYYISNSDDYYLYISFYILSYGKDPDDITTSIYSEPVYLGTLKFDVELTNDKS